MKMKFNFIFTMSRISGDRSPVNPRTHIPLGCWSQIGAIALRAPYPSSHPKGFVPQPAAREDRMRRVLALLIVVCACAVAAQEQAPPKGMMMLTIFLRH